MLMLTLILMFMLTFLVTSPKLKFFYLPFVNCLFESHQNMNNESSCHNVFPRKRGSTLCPKWNDGWVNGKHQKLARTRLNVQLCSSQADKRKSNSWILREGKYICFRPGKKNGKGENSFFCRGKEKREKWEDFFCNLLFGFWIFWLEVLLAISYRHTILYSSLIGMPSTVLMCFV